MKGLFGKFLDVDLSSSETSDYVIPEEWIKKYLGGRGIAARILLEELNGGENPYGPENILIFATGPLQGFPLPGHYVVMAKSPKTGSVSDSYAGGRFYHELGSSGYDGIIIRGKADSPTYIALLEGKASLNDASSIWGNEIDKTESKLKKAHGGSVASIGIAGENLVQAACIINDRHRAAGRPGFGAVMGSKKLKAIVVKGGLKKQLAAEKNFRSASAKFLRRLSQERENWKYGTAGGTVGLNELGILPTKYFKEGFFDKAEKISGKAIYKKILQRRGACFGCRLACQRLVETKFCNEKIYPRYGGPEYETVASFGSLLCNSDLDSIALANQKCNKYGLDTISTGNLIALAIEASQRGLLNYKLKWGDPNEIVKLIDKIAKRKGLGKLLAKGIGQAAAEIGADFAVHSKGQEIPMHDPRGKKGLAISYAASPRGGTHLEGFHDTMIDKATSPELGIKKPLDRFSWKGKVRAVKVFEDSMSFINSSILCCFAVHQSGKRYNLPLIRKILSYATGIKIDKGEMLKIGERAFNLLKIHAAREGITRKDDKIPNRLRKPLPKGPSAGEPIPKKELQKRIDEYYEARGWNRYGPTEEKLQKLQMSKLKKFLP